MVLSALSFDIMCDLSHVTLLVHNPSLASGQDLSSTGQIRSDISHDDISDSDHTDHCPVMVSQESDPCHWGPHHDHHH